MSLFPLLLIESLLAAPIKLLFCLLSGVGFRVGTGEKGLFAGK